MQLIATIGGGYVNADHVEQWRPLDSAGWGLYDDAGKLLGTVAGEPDQADTWPVVAAYPGFRVLVVVPGDAPYIEEHHVIAWRIPPVGDFPMPVTLQDVPDANCVIQSPTDRIIAQGSGEFANRDALLEEYKKQKAQEAARNE